jgi:hypothetical protein
MMRSGGLVSGNRHWGLAPVNLLSRQMLFSPPGKGKDRAYCRMRLELAQTIFAISGIDSAFDGRFRNWRIDLSVISNFTD